MNTYEVRLHKNPDLPPQILYLTQVSDFAAIRTARRMAAGERLEVWRDRECIYVDDHSPAS